MAVHRTSATLRPKPLVQSAEALDRFTRERVREELAGALRRKGAVEGRVAGLTRALAPHSAAIRKEADLALSVVADRGRFDRPLYRGLLLQAAASGTPAAPDAIGAALAEENPPTCAFAAGALLLSGNGLREPLQRLAGSASSSLAFAAEVSRACRGEAAGARLASLATRLKESARLDFTDHALFPLSFLARLPATLVPALRVLRKLERDLGRWMFLARASMLATDGSPLVEARERATTGVVSGRAAWACVAWALDASMQLPTKLAADTLQRVSGKKDPTFLFDLGAKAQKAAELHLRNLAESASGVPVVRSLHLLATSYNDAGARQKVMTTAARGSEETKGIALAAAWDMCSSDSEREKIRDLAGSHATSRNLATMGWAALVRLACDHGLAGPLLTSRHVRWLHGGDPR